jgi:hypothetical protein
MIYECVCSLSDLVAVPLSIAGAIGLCVLLNMNVYSSLFTLAHLLSSLCFRVAAAQSPERLVQRRLEIRQIPRQTPTAVSSGELVALIHLCSAIMYVRCSAWCLELWTC